jgi:MFS family permease
MTTAAVAASEPWYRSLNATQWKTVFASNLGWMFDGYETFALILVVGVALRDLLDPSQFAQIPAFAGTIIGITLLGWGIGGVIGGVLADYIGRRRTMIFAILGLFDNDRPFGLRLGLGFVRAFTLLSRRSHWL